MRDSLRPACPNCRAEVFGLRLRKDEGTAVVTCDKCHQHTFLLDSGEYWFESPSAEYPDLAKCTCGATTFRLTLDYTLRDDGEIERVALTSHCSRCRKEKRRLSIPIDYTPTKHLRSRPLAPCENPELRCDVRELSLYALPADMQRVSRYLADQGCSFAGVVRAGREDVAKSLTADEVAALFAKRGALPAFHQMYAALKPIALDLADVSTAKREGVYWKRREVIQLESPMDIGWGSKSAKLYTIHFASEYIAGEKLKAKSARFRALGKGLAEWLGRELVTWRGPDCFDNEQVHLRVFGQKYRSKTGRQ
jgi:hypothetical protein